MIGSPKTKMRSRQAWFINAEHEIRESLTDEQRAKCDLWLSLYSKGKELEETKKHFESIAKNLSNLIDDIGWSQKDVIDLSDFEQVWIKQRRELLMVRMKNLNDELMKVDNEQFEIMQDLRKEIGDDKTWYLWIKCGAMDYADYDE